MLIVVLPKNALNTRNVGALYGMKFIKKIYRLFKYIQVIMVRRHYNNFWPDSHVIMKCYLFVSSK